MSILIKGRKKPKNCSVCQFHGFGGYKNELIVCSLTGRSAGQLSNVPDCPLIEVPTPHGALIDADDFRKAVEGLPNCYNGFSDTYDKSCIIGLIDEMPTIIEAEEGAEE